MKSVDKIIFFEKFKQQEDDDLSLKKNSNKQNLSEDLFKMQKLKIKEVKESNSKKRTENTSLSKDNFSKYKDDIIMLTLNDKNLWECTLFDYEYFEGEEIPKVDDPWEMCSQLENYTSHRGVELRNTSLRSVVDFDLGIFGLEINTAFSLKGESSCWIFSRSSINITNERETVKDFDVLNKFSTIIKISKEDKCQRCFVSLCLLAEDENGDSVFTSFSKRQLINFSMSKNTYNFENDICEFKLSLIDLGDEKLALKILVNDSKEPNVVEGNFFLPNPLGKKSKIMIGGTGQSCVMKTLICKPFIKMGDFTEYGSERKNCDCCLVF